MSIHLMKDQELVFGIMFEFGSLMDVDDVFQGQGMNVKNLAQEPNKFVQFL